jgi:Peptidase family C25/Propeptide_C25
MKKILPILLVVVIISSGFGAAFSTQVKSNELTIKNTIHFSEPVLKDQTTYLTVQETEATSYATEPGNPVLPIYTKLFTFPFRTTIKDVTFTTSSLQIERLTKEIIPAPQQTPVSNSQEIVTNEKQVKNNEIYSSTKTYPLSRLTYTVGSGLDGNDHVTLVSVQYYPILYSPQQRMLFFTPDVQITITYELPDISLSSPKGGSLLIIAPEEFSTALQPLITHKNQHGIITYLWTTESIAAQYPGRDLQEKIKYAIMDSINIDDASYVLLVGGVDKIPIRRSYVSMFHNYDEEMITDLYYSDIYDAQGNFSSWDTNNNDKFGESSDKVDLYPDVYLGRLACDNVDDVNIVVDKIIHYETETYGSDWFHTMIFIGGNTFRWTIGSNDGEENNKVIMGIMSQFTPKIIWTSKMNFNRMTISKAITDGAGFLDYSGHGFEHGMGTFTPGGLRMKYYLTGYIKDEKNGYKLPIMFFDACLTAKIDYVLQDTLNYSKIKNIVSFFVQTLGINTSERIPCYAWVFLTHEGGGAIATVGATRTAFGGIDNGAGKMSVEFFSAYNTSQYLGEMITKMQNGYITDVPNDAFTVEEFILLGDPTLRIGGYPTQ